MEEQKKDIEIDKKEIEGDAASVSEKSDMEKSDAEQSHAEQPVAENIAEQSAAEQVADIKMSESSDARPGKRTGLIVVLCVLAALLVAIGTGCYVLVQRYEEQAEYYKTRFLPGTTVNGIPCEEMTAEQVAEILESEVLEGSLTVIGRDEVILGSLSAQEINRRHVGTLEAVEGLLERQDEMRWWYAREGKESYSYLLEGFAAEYDREAVRAIVLGWESFQKDAMTQPENAYLSEYLESSMAYEIVPETRGTAFDPEAAAELVLAAVDSGERSISLEEAGCYFEAEITAENEELQERAEELNRIVGAKITYDWNGNEIVLDGSTVHQWIITADEARAAEAAAAEESEASDKKDEEDTTYRTSNKYYAIDRTAAEEFVAEQSKKWDTYGKHRQFTTTLGETVKVLNGGYGWKVDKEDEVNAMLAQIEAGEVLAREPEWWVTARKKGADDIGDSYVEIDLTHQHLYLYWKGQLVLETDFVSGDMSNGNMTPPGLFRLTYRATNAVLRGANYETPVSYWMPFNGNVGMHDATWRTEFGGDIYLTNGSHGCINLPFDMAQAIFGYVSTGFPIICYYY